MRSLQRVLVLGATGHVGQAVVRHWLALGAEVSAATRQRDPAALRGLPVRTMRVSDGLTELPDLAQGHDALIDAAAPHPLGLVGGQAAVDDAVRRTRWVVEAARRHGMPLVFVSSFTTLGRGDSPWRAMYPYFAAKAAMEAVVLGAGVPVVVVNPAACLGPWEYRGDGSSLVRMALAGRLPVVMDHEVNVIDVRDVAGAIELALRAECFGQRIPLAGHNTTMAALVRRITGRAPAVMPSAMVSVTALFTEAMFAMAGRSAPDLWRAVPLIAESFAMTESLEQQRLGVIIRPLEETLRDAVVFHSVSSP